MTRALIALACLLGAAGVALDAAAAHSDSSLGTAANILLFHAPAVMAAAIAANVGLMRRPVALAGAATLLLGAALFSGDLAMRVYAGQRLFPFAAPTGGTLLIAGWLLLAVAAVWRHATNK
jgi:uncharacterized membrane protein YgdD (TMEM256/DUF423 family)